MICAAAQSGSEWHYSASSEGLNNQVAEALHVHDDQRGIF